MNILERQVLKLNKIWAPIAVEDVQHVFEEMSDWDAKDDNWKRIALDCSYPQLPDGTYDLSADPLSINTVGWDEWLTLPIRPYDHFITANRGKRVRVPEIVIAPDYDKMPERKPAKNLRAIYELYNRKCVYTGRLLPRSRSSVDHVIPRSRGGSDELDNLVLADIEINNLKGSKLNKEAGLPEPKIRTLRTMKAWETLRPHPDHPTWTYFLYVKE